MRFWTLLAVVCVATACAVNPVTGQRHVQFYDTAWEQDIGSNYYAPLRQQQGGDFLLDPELTDYVQSVGDKLAARARRKGELQFEFNIINDSTPNAWALPGGKISINRGLLTELKSEAELAAVLGHEIVHADAAHTARQQSKGVLTQVGAAAGMVLIGTQTDSSAGRAAAVMVPVLGAQLLTQKYSRDAEREADQYGMQYMSEAGYDPAGAVQLQETFVRLSEGRRQDWLSGLFASHPASRERVERNRETAAGLPQGGDSGDAPYQQKTAYLRRVEPAYAAYDRAMKHASNEEYGQAQAALDEALAIETREGLFHALNGDLKMQAGENQSALDSYERAVSLNGDFYYNRLRRGQVYLDMGRLADARTDLQRSLDLLPTATAHYLLGNLDRDAGNRKSAAQHYESAAGSDSETGRKAKRELALLEISSNPQKYVATAPASDGDGTLYCLVGNRTSIALAQITVDARYMDDEGASLQASRVLQENLAEGAQANISLGWKTSNTSSVNQRLQCTVTQARVAD